MLTKKLNYKISGTFVQDLIIRKMQKAAHFSNLWHEALQNGDDVRDEIYCRMMTYEQTQIWVLLEIQGFKWEDDEYIRVSEYILDAIASMKEF